MENERRLGFDDFVTWRNLSLMLTMFIYLADIVVERPDERSIITYVVTYYHYFSKMKAIAVEGKRIGKVVYCVILVEPLLTSRLPVVPR